MNKGIAINTILYLLIGVLVVGVVIYLVYSYTTGPGMDIQDCRAIVQSWCAGCNIASWATGAGVKSATSDVYTCINTYFRTGTLAASINCNVTYSVPGDTETFCEQYGG